MHKTVVPRLSGVHRFACLALYRALLRQCAKLPNTAPELDACKPLIQQKFHKYKRLQSPSQTLNALKAGYEAYDLLHSASAGNQHDVNRIISLISETRELKQRESEMQRALTKYKQLKQKPPSPREQRREASRRAQEQTALRHPDATPILSRPRPVVSGKRRVPVLVNARGVPFLRIKKPQPKNLSGVIRTKLEKRWSRIKRRERLHEDLHFSKDEDDWDSLTLGLEKDTFEQPIRDAISVVNNQIHETDEANRRLAEAMWNVVLAERKLAAEEQAKEKGEQTT
ncbi:hypothetical protein BDV25DRAFT_152069 [Aspergillus avenaceus]|uniref:Complex 1 LYR protein domain-containing protein n=1 Tax=Aspergillus avenaceus TaxID=36643 RepID=A0A5N6U0I1_ASPAV|nr:hypothetical protein BDV25DRAFT_152069 [Aspergillus avenaceus]